MNPDIERENPLDTLLTSPDTVWNLSRSTTDEPSWISFTAKLGPLTASVSGEFGIEFFDRSFEHISVTKDGKTVATIEGPAIRPILDSLEVKSGGKKEFTGPIGIRFPFVKGEGFIAKAWTAIKHVTNINEALLLEEVFFAVRNVPVGGSYGWKLEPGEVAEDEKATFLRLKTYSLEFNGLDIKLTHKEAKCRETLELVEFGSSERIPISSDEITLRVKNRKGEMLLFDSEYSAPRILEELKERNGWPSHSTILGTSLSK